LTIFRVLNATDFVVPALEILDNAFERTPPRLRPLENLRTIDRHRPMPVHRLGGQADPPEDSDLR